MSNGEFPEPIMKRSVLVILPAILALLSACNGESPTQPTPAAVQPTVVTDGVYNVVAPIGSFDPAWGDFTGYVYTTVLTIQHDSTTPSQLFGTFSGFQLRDAAGDAGTWRTAGTMSGSIGPTGKITIELVNMEKNFSWSASGDFVDSRIEGSWGRAHFYGKFVASLRPSMP